MPHVSACCITWNRPWTLLCKASSVGCDFPAMTRTHLAPSWPAIAIQEVIQAIRLDAVDYFNFNCGIANFVRMADIADAAGIPCWHGSEVDLGILEASYIHACAAARNCTLRSDIFGERIRENDLISQGLEITNGQARVLQGPGLGVELDLEALERYRVSGDGES